MVFCVSKDDLIQFEQFLVTLIDWEMEDHVFLIVSPSLNLFLCWFSFSQGGTGDEDLGHTKVNESLALPDAWGWGGWIGYRTRIEMDSELGEFAIREKKLYQNRMIPKVWDRVKCD